MSRPIKAGLDYFPHDTNAVGFSIRKTTGKHMENLPPKFKYQEDLMLHKWAQGIKIFRQYARSCADRYLLNKEVRKYILKRDHYQCVLCGNSERLTIDHGIPVYQATPENFELINSFDNLRTLCLLCNSKRKPDVETS